MSDSKVINTISYKTNSPKDINVEENKFTFTNIIDTKYSNLSWYRTLKDESSVLANFISHEQAFIPYNITIDDAILFLSSLININDIINKQNLYTPVPSRFLTKRNQISRAKVYAMIGILRSLGYVDIKLYNGEYLYRLNLTNINNDPYVMKRAEKFRPRDMYAYKLCVEDFKSLYMCPLSKNTRRKQEIMNIIGLSFAWNEMNIKQQNGLYQIRKNNKFCDHTLIYMDIPVEFISKITMLSPNYIRSKINTLSKQTHYITRHDKVYADYKLKSSEKLTKGQANNSHMDTFDYQSFFPLNDYKTISDKNECLEDGRITLTQDSVIIFKENFEKTKLGKKITKNMEYYKNIVLQYMLFNVDTRLISNINALDIKELNLETMDYANVNPLASEIPEDINIFIDKSSINTTNNVVSDKHIGKLLTKHNMVIDKTILSNLEYRKEKVIVPRFYKTFNITTEDGKTKRVNKSTESACKFIKKLTTTTLKVDKYHLKECIDRYNEAENYLVDQIDKYWYNFNVKDISGNERYLNGFLLNKTIGVIQHFGYYSETLLNKVKEKLSQYVEFYERFNNNVIDALNCSLIEELVDSPYEHTIRTEVYENGLYVVDNVKDINNSESLLSSLLINA